MIAGGIGYLEKGEGAPVLCLHGIGGHARAFAPQMGALDAQLISWSMPGYGESATLDGGPTFPGLATAVVRLLDALGIEAAHLAGHSIGGMVALETACLFPDRVASLALIGTTPRFGGRDDSFKDAFLKARLAPLEAGMTMQEMAAEATPSLVGPATPDDIKAEITEIMGEVAEATWRDILRCLVTFDRAADLATLNLPVCCIAGGHDMNAPARTMEKMAAAIPGATYHLIDRAGHMIPQETPDEINAILREFYEGQA